MGSSGAVLRVRAASIAPHLTGDNGDAHRRLRRRLRADRRRQRHGCPLARGRPRGARRPHGTARGRRCRGAAVLGAPLERRTRARRRRAAGGGTHGRDRRGARVTFVDRVPAALAFVRASAAANGCVVDTVAADATTGAVRGPFDLVLAAEVLYDRSAFRALAGTLAALLAPGGRALLADAGRIDTRDFYQALDAVGLPWAATEHRVREEGMVIAV